MAAATAAAAAARKTEKIPASDLKRPHAEQAEVRMKGLIRIVAVLLLLTGLSVRGVITGPLRFDTTTPFRCEVQKLEEIPARRGDFNETFLNSDIMASPLESLYAGTENGTQLMDWLLAHARQMYPEFQDGQDIYLGTPSLVAGNPTTTSKGTTVMSVLVYSSSPKFRYLIFLMLCDVRSPLAATTCQDSGFEHFYVPPECDRRFWLNPQKEATYAGITLVGPADPRLFLDEDGNLGATTVMRGCHPETRFGNHTPIHSVYVLSWKKKKNRQSGDGEGIWRAAGLPKLLDLRGTNNSFLGDSYPSITKSWISIPGPLGHPSPKNASNFRFSLGWTGGMRENVVYKVAEATLTLYGVVPAQESVPHSRAALGQYRASTNLVPFRGALLGMGHRRAFVDKRVLYLHYWYAMCPDEPHQAVACSDAFRLNPDPASRINFSLGLAADERVGGSLYLAWSEADSVPLLTRYTPDDILRTFHNSSFARSRGGAYLNVSGSFAKVCSDGRAVESSSTR
jgi:hypothetical protein